MTAAQNARAAKAVDFVRWLRESSRDMMTEGDPGGAAQVARLAIMVAKQFGAPERVTNVVPVAELDELDEVKMPRRHTYAGPVEDDR